MHHLRLWPVLFMIFGLPPRAWAEASTPSPLGEEQRSPRHFRLGVTVGQLLNRPWTSNEPTGAGITTSWDFFTSSRSSLGIHAAYRHYSGDSSLGQLGYGLIMTHYIQPGSSTGISGWYLNYGLLMQVVRRRGIDGSGTAHDTKLSAGYDFGGERHWYAEAAYHYSRLRTFEANEANLDYAELAFGARLR